jgi:hypothetical protein
MRLVPFVLELSLSVVALGCSSSTTATTTITRPELVAVSPDDFLGSLHCGADTDAGADGGAGGAGGAEADAELDAGAGPLVHSYVATLFDVTLLADGGFSDVQLASSPPTSCLVPVTFSYVVAAHRYLAEVDVYDQKPGELGPLTAGGRSQFLTMMGSDVRVTPHSTYTCGGYPATPGDGGSYGGAGSLGEDAAGAGRAGAFPPGILSYDGLTQTAHYCLPGQPSTSN